MRGSWKDLVFVSDDKKTIEKIQTALDEMYQLGHSHGKFTKLTYYLISFLGGAYLALMVYSFLGR